MSTAANPARLGLSVVIVLVTCAAATTRAQAAQPAEPSAVQDILDAAGVRGGLVVHLGCGDGKLTAALRAGDAYLVQGLDTSPDNVHKARDHIRSLGLYGPVSVDQYDGKHLPYVDNLVNLFVAEDVGSVAMDEVKRVLSPGGVACIRQGGSWKTMVKPRPKEIDEWTHFLHDASNNAVAQDSVVGPPRQLQWVGGPKWARSHDHLASVSAAVCAGGRILYIVDEGPTAAVVLRPKWSLVARDAFSGVVLWQRPITRWEWHLRAFRSGPPELAKRLVAVGDRAYVTLQIDGPLSELEAATGRTVRTYEGTEGTLETVCDGGKLFVAAGGQAPVGDLLAFSAKDGKQLWKSKCRECYNAPVDVLVAGGLVWTGELVRANEPGITEGLDPETGQVRRTRPKDQEFFQCGMGHGRCYRNKATCRYLVLGRSGVEFIDVATGSVVPNHWTRGTCQYGVIPCNGLLYAPPHSCACFIRSKLNGFNCLAPKREPPAAPDPPKDRLQHGSAYGEIRNPKSEIQNSDDWPTYRHDAVRSGRSGSPVPSELAPAWQADLGGKLSGIVVAGGRLFVAQIDAQTVHALRADDGRPLWSCTAGGRVDSPPTVWQGRVLFGAADGWVTCLRASDGALAWRFRAAPRDRRIVAYGQVESLWPVPGSVLVHDGAVTCVAGRSSYLDGGVRLVRLDAKSGRLLSETTMDDRNPQTGFQRKGVVRGTDMPGALPDVLSCDGQSIFMRHRRFDLQGGPQEPTVPHLFSAAGFLDDAWWHRTYWMLDTIMGNDYGGWPNPGARVPAGRLLVMDGQRVFGFGRNQYSHTGAHVGIDAETVFHYSPGRYNPRQTYYQAFAISRSVPAAQGPQAKPRPKQRPKLQGKAGAKNQAKPKPKPRRQPGPAAKKYLWTEKLPILVRAMVLAPDTLLLAGPPDFFTTDDPAGALAGKEGGTLIAVSPTDGSKQAEYRLQAPPVFDGMAAAGGRLYMATTSGKVVCFGRK